MTGALARYLADALDRATAPIEGDDAPAATAQHLLAGAHDIARDLAAIAPGEPVLARIANAPPDIAAMLGVWLAGGVVVPVAANAPPLATDALRQATGARFQVDGRSVARLSPARPPEREGMRDAALVIFTSGTTGRPKGVVIGHDRMAAKLAVLDRLVGLGAGDTVVVPLRLTFIFGIWVSLLALRSGARLVLVPRFTPDGAARSLAAGATVLAAVPTMLRAILAGAPLTAPRLRLVLAGGETLGAALSGRLRTALPHAGVSDLYGLTETGSCDFCLPPADQAAAAGSIGGPTAQVTWRLIDQAGREVPAGADAELAIATPFGMLGYLDDPALTAAAFSDGHFRTGDLARQRPDGRVEIVGRLKDIISRGGNKIAPAEIEALLCTHPDVAEALCAGVPDARFGEAIHAIVVPRANASLTPEGLRRWAAERTERYKVPDAIYIGDALPLGSTGKVRRAGVAELAAAAKDGLQGR